MSERQSLVQYPPGAPPPKTGDVESGVMHRKSSPQSASAVHFAANLDCMPPVLDEDATTAELDELAEELEEAVALPPPVPVAGWSLEQPPNATGVMAAVSNKQKASDFPNFMALAYRLWSCVATATRQGGVCIVGLHVPASEPWTRPVF